MESGTAAFLFANHCIVTISDPFGSRDKEEMFDSSSICLSFSILSSGGTGSICFLEIDSVSNTVPVPGPIRLG